MSRVPALLALALSGLVGLAGCGADGPEDAAAAPPGAGIPMGAVGAVGVSFEGVSARPDPLPVKSKARPHGGKPAPDPLPTTPDPFAEPPAPEGPAPAPPARGAPRPPHAPHASESKETTL